MESGNIMINTAWLYDYDHRGNLTDDIPFLSISRNCVAISSHHCNEVGRLKLATCLINWNPPLKK